jgi:HNH endonuclease
MEDQNEFKIFLEGFPDLVEGLSNFFDEECPNKIVKYKSNWGIIEPGYCKEGRMTHNRKISQPLEGVCGVVKDYNILLLPRGENKTNPIIVTVQLIEETIDTSSSDKQIDIDFNSFRYRGHTNDNIPIPIRVLEEKVRNLSLDPPESSKRKSLPKQVQDSVWIKYESANDTTGKCYCCGGTIKLIPKSFECGHVISRYNGGNDYISNLRPICMPCNRSMGTENMRDYMIRYGYDKINPECFLTLSQNANENGLE